MDTFHPPNRPPTRPPTHLPPPSNPPTHPPAHPTPPTQVSREKHELRGRLLALQGRGEEAASEVTFLGRQAEAEMCRQAGRASLAGVAAKLRPLPPADAPAGAQLEMQPPAAAAVAAGAKKSE